MASSSTAATSTISGANKSMVASKDISIQPLQDIGEEFHDSGYSSVTSTSDKSNDRPQIGIQSDQTAVHSRIPAFAKLTSGKSDGKKLLFSDIEVDDSDRQAYTRIQPHFEKELRDYILAHPRRGEPCYPLWIRLMMVGTSYNDADVHIVVFCKPKYKSVIRRFFEEDHVTELCNSPREGSRAFKLHVEGSAPRLRLARVQVITDSTYATQHTLCGLPISLQHPSGRIRNATLGGVIELVVNFGNRRLYGISAGHTLEELDAEDDEAAEYTHDDMDDNSDNEIQEVGVDEDEDYGLGLLFDDHHISETRDIYSNSWVFANSIVSGTSVPTPPINYFGKAKRHDWALFDMSSYVPNEVMGQHGRKVHMSTMAPGKTGSRDVYLLSGSGPRDVCKKGVLSQAFGRIALGPALELVDAYILSLFETSDIRDGDSGSWIVDCQTLELYGHLVATGFLDEGIAIPMNGVFEDIKEQYSAISVGLPIDTNPIPHIDATNTLIDDGHHGIPMSWTGFQSIVGPHSGLLGRFGYGPDSDYLFRSQQIPDSGYQSMNTSAQSMNTSPQFLLTQFPHSGYADQLKKPS